MDHQAYEDESRFAKYVESLAGVIGHADRVVPLRHYCVGLLAAEGRKSVEPLAAVTAPAGLADAASKAVAFCGQCSVVGRAGFGQGARDRAAGD